MIAFLPSQILKKLSTIKGRIIVNELASHNYTITVVGHSDFFIFTFVCLIDHFLKLIPISDVLRRIENWS